MTSTLLPPPPPSSPNLSHNADKLTADTTPIPFPLRTVDLSTDTTRHTIIAQGTPDIYQGHPTTLLLPDGRTMYCVWTYNHGGACGPLKRSDDGGLTWSDLLPVPGNWSTVENCPTIFRLPDPDGRTYRLFIYAGQGPDGCMAAAHSNDDGRTWSPMRSNGLVCVMPFTSIIPIDGGRRLLGLATTRRPNDPDGKQWSLQLTQSISTDGGFTWSPWSVPVDDDPALRFGEPFLLPSPPPLPPPTTIITTNAGSVSSAKISVAAHGSPPPMTKAALGRPCVTFPSASQATVTSPATRPTDASLLSSVTAPPAAAPAGISSHGLAVTKIFSPPPTTATTTAKVTV
ncbi:sialidase family protein [Geminisphaera colitermitum]|uniref:sialidase family protein n=1 Tax=Geminisphaera colitermitum TaxID=1148786 RepID=UPI000693B007|nr:sialidase family protein [Geminisphaera colitermitum]